MGKGQGQGQGQGARARASRAVCVTRDAKHGGVGTYLTVLVRGVGGGAVGQQQVCDVSPTAVGREVQRRHAGALVVRGEGGPGAVRRLRWRQGRGGRGW